MAINTLKYIENHLKIRDKDSNIVPLKLNTPQMKLYDIIRKQSSAGKPIRVIVLKARQMGFSTLVEAIMFKRTATAENVQSAIVTHEADATNNLYTMTRRYYDEITEPLLKPQIEKSNAKELQFGDLKSGIRCYTAGNETIGRSATLNNVHISEYAFWRGNKKDTLTGLLNAVPNNPNTMIVIESTANGYDDFKDLWDAAVAGNNDFVPVFVGWNELNEYRIKGASIELTTEEQHLQELYGLDIEQLAWRRNMTRNNCNGDLDLFQQEYPLTPEEAFISTGHCYFGTDGKKKIIERMSQLKEEKPLAVGFFDYAYDGLRISDVKWVDDEHGYIKIHEQPRENVPYVLGGDTAGEGSDYFVGQVLDNTTGKQVAVFCEQMGEELYARQIYCLGMYYNTALVGIEINFSTYPVKELERLKYPKQFLRQREDVIGTQIEHKFGFRTTTSTRPAALAELATIVREEIEAINDVDTLREMLTFIKDDNGKPVAEVGKHDDRVMALAIAHYIRPQQKYEIPGAPQPPKHYNFEGEKPKPNPLGYGQKIGVIK